MKKEFYIPFKDLGKHQELYPRAIPLIGRIFEMDGEFFGEIKGYCDEFGNPTEGPPIEAEIYH
ncbi:hypothetical protein [Planomicrobium sp. MB-3u-38]|uniref:hypothetical protein n=1 Tax=Planomicrobium sp. MB-3u-38 TaxID=2058318 RepID=UPI000C7C21E9|nr:hypothetical protein [Planomicrobium sp. MB-3u-38]PKH09819.1 hypothetical protein CXF70_11415 [Planomicrobium sp. MB-3u-38]